MRKFLLRAGDFWRNSWVVLRNWRLSLSRRPLDYVFIELYGGLPEYTPALPFWRRFVSIPFLAEADPEPTMAALRYSLELIAGDPRVKGIVVRLDGLEIGWATAQSLRSIFKRFRQSGKKVVAYADDFDTLKYYVASIADSIIAPPIAGWNVIGLRVESLFFADALRALDIEAEVITISPYKDAGDPLTRMSLSPESEENLDLLLDAYYSEITQGLSSGRNLPTERIQELIDMAPIPASQALESGLFDRVCYQDEIEAFLRDQANAEQIRLESLPQAWKRLKRPTQKRSGKLVGVISFEGTLMTGGSRRVPVPFPIPFVGNQRLGQEDVLGAIRRAEQDASLAAVVIYVDSRGGSAIASDLIWREITRLRTKKPVVIYMNEVAASAAYYIALGGNWIISQPLSITGSIGVLFVRIATQGLLARLKVNRVSLQRGAHAGIYTDDAKLDSDEYELIRRHVFDLFERFNSLVAAGRKLDQDQLQQVGEGRVWLGKQALERKLVDQMGDFEDALKKARELAGLPTDVWTPHVWLTSGGAGVLPAPFAAQPSELIKFLTGLGGERTWMILPWEIKVR